MIEIKRCNFEDDVLAGQFIEIDNQNFSSNESWNYANFKRDNHLKNELSCYLLKNNKVEGFLIGSAYFDVDNQSQLAHINRIVISNDSQGKGFGSKLIRYFEKTATSLGIHSLTLEAKNDELLYKFYTKLGFNQLKNKDLDLYLKIKNKQHRKDVFINQEQLVFKK